MEWVRENWLFIVFALLFIGMHFFGYGCGGHRGHGGQKEEKHSEHVGANLDQKEEKTADRRGRGCCTRGWST